MGPLIPYVAIAVIVIVVYLLYRQGLAVTKSIAAILFVFRPRRDADRASLNSCTGWVRHVARLRGGQAYELTLDCQLSKGSGTVSLLDRDKQPLLRLDRQSPNGKLELEGKGRYYLHWEFEHATGQCELRWKEIETTGEKTI